jgi:hypothetical protein
MWHFDKEYRLINSAGACVLTDLQIYCRIQNDNVESEMKLPPPSSLPQPPPPRMMTKPPPPLLTITPPK